MAQGLLGDNGTLKFHSGTETDRHKSKVAIDLTENNQFYSKNTTPSPVTTPATNTTASEEEACPAGWVNAQTEGCFAFLVEETESSWLGASLACEQAGGYLAEPNQMDFLTGLAGLEADFTGIRNWWIGLSDLNHEGIWIWQHSNQEADEFFWGEGSPEKSPGNSLDCAYQFSVSSCSTPNDVRIYIEICQV